MAARMEMEIPEGYLGNLTPAQEDKLREFWEILIQSWDTSVSSPDKSSVASSSPPKQRKSFFSLSRSQAQPSNEALSTIPDKLLSSFKNLGAGANELKAVQSLLSQLNGDRLRSAYLSLLKQDHPDVLMLRFLRAEKWDIPKAWIKFTSALNWRVNVYNVDEEVLLNGEECNLERSKKMSGDAVDKDNGESFMLQCRTGKGHFHGCDKWGRPICIVRVRFHDPNAQTQKGLNDYIVHCIETSRLMFVDPVETITIVFDLTSFSLSNWDFPPIKFIVEAFQENYPESLGNMIFYNAPWIFSGFWKLIHGILDPVVASKVHFLNGADGLEQLIPRNQIMKELGGDEDWEYKYTDPKPHENGKMRDTTTRDTILAERTRIADNLFNITTEWISDPQTDSLKSRRDETIQQLRDNYWKLDPYVRSRTIMDRTGVIQPGGKIEFYPAIESPTQSIEEPKVMVEHVDATQPTPVAA